MVSSSAGSAWFSREDHKKGTLAAGQLADLAVLSDDYFSVPEDRIKSIITKGQTTTVGNDDTSVQPGYFPRGGQ